MKIKSLIVALIPLLLCGCVAQRWNDSSTDKAGVTHDRAWVEVDFYGPLGERTVGTLDVGGTGASSHARITEQGMKSTMTLQDLANVIGVLRGVPPTTQP